MPKVKAEMKSWQIFAFARKHLGRSAIYSLFGKKNARTVEYWCQDPKFTNKPDGATDPIQGVKNLLDTLDDYGHAGVVRACLAYLAAGTSAAEDHETLTELLPSIHEEILADYAAVASLQQAINDGCDISVVTALKKEATAEIERTVAKYIEDYRR